MPLYYFVYFFLLLGFSFLVVRHFLLRRTSLSKQLFAKGIKAENMGLYEEATNSYENALSEIRKSRFHHEFENQIRQKLKVLQTVTTYIRDQDFVRENNSWIS
jgi:hypothetical protein